MPLELITWEKYFKEPFLRSYFLEPFAEKVINQECKNNMSDTELGYIIEINFSALVGACDKLYRRLLLLKLMISLKQLEGKTSVKW